MRSNLYKRDPTKYCRYHRNHGHDTEDCIKLKDVIENLIHRGWLIQFMARPEGYQRPSAKQPMLQPPREAPPSSCPTSLREIHTIIEGPEQSRTSNRSRKQHVRITQHEAQAEIYNTRLSQLTLTASRTITFTNEEVIEVIQPHDDALVVTL